ncbi:MAG TPA: hypothetical protein VFT45_11555, partial [Longimicrobium sp.]|nr:hypothetical protein [Longimicrobium sp.]
LDRRLGAEDGPTRWRVGAGWAVYLLLLAGGVVAGRARWGHDWAGFVGWAVLLGTGGVLVLVALDPAVRAFVLGRLRALRAVRPAGGGAS